MAGSKLEVANSKRGYLIALNGRRSRRALVAAVLVSVLTFINVVASALNPSYTESAFHYFTILSNLLSAAGAMFMLPYAVEGLRKKRFTLPKWVSLFQYAGAVSVFITMASTILIIIPTEGIHQAFKGANFPLHLVTPISAIVLFLMVETGHIITKKETVLAQIPFWAYGLVYVYMVVIVGKEHGGWEDIYQLTTALPTPISISLVLAIGYAVAVTLRVAHNYFVERSVREMTAHWDDGVTGPEMRVEAFGLGRYVAKRVDRTEIPIPIDLFELMASRCDVSVEQLARAYTKGVLDSLKELEDAE